MVANKPKHSNKRATTMIRSNIVAQLISGLIRYIRERVDNILNACTRYNGSARHFSDNKRNAPNTPIKLINRTVFRLVISLETHMNPFLMN